MRLTANDFALAHSVGGDILLGKAFAFVSKDAFARPALAWVARLFGGRPEARIIPLLGPEPVPLPGATLAPPTIALSLAVVTSDKALYRERRDDVHLLALDPLAPESVTALQIRQNGADFAQHPVTLDARGAAAVTLRDLPIGDYEVRLRGAEKGAPACTFTVAAYRLAPLVASLVERRLQGERLTFTLRLESFGSAVEGKVALELTDRGRRIARESADAIDGLVTAAFTLSGEGPHAINVQLAADAGRTATVPIVGSRAAERSQTTFSTLGYEITGALIPGEGAMPVRGVYLQEGALRPTPFRLERVDASRARLTASVEVDSACVVVIDPTFPARRADAVDPDMAPHPATVDDCYRRAEAAFHEGRFKESRALFEAGRAASPAPHPNYAYYVACCFAREGDRGRAVAALAQAIREGWKDFDHLSKDDDLAALRGDERYEALKRRGVIEIAIAGMRAGQSIDVDVSEPMAVLAVGAYVKGEPWEGWAATITPASMKPTLTVPDRAVPGDEVRVEIDTGRRGDDVSVYVVVKDARLLTPDTPESRLAGSIKSVAEAASKELGLGKPTRTLAEELPPLPTFLPTFGAPPSFGVPPPAPGGFGPPVSMESMAAPSFGAPPSFGVPPPAPMAARPAAPMAAPRAALHGAKGGAASAGPYREADATAMPAVEEPEVIFAGLVETRAGRASVAVRLGPDFADYVVEAFAVAGADWAATEKRFRAERDVFVSLDVPAFVHPDDGAIGRVHVGARSGARVRVTRDGAEVPLLAEGRALASGEPLPRGRAELSFLVGPGHWEATIEDASGAVDRTARDVEVPGKLRRLARTVQFLEPGQSVSRDADASIRHLQVLPGIDGPFTALLDATADYGHACCEQTAAKMLSACAMYALAGSDRRRRDRAESIILAGVRREASMWLRGRGFKMYPESTPEPSPYWSPLAARHLQNLALLRDLGPSRALAAAIDEALAMAEDAMRAHGLEWPPRRITSCGDAYAAIRFGKDHGAALAFVRANAGADLPAAPQNPWHGGAVAMRAEGAYAAAALIRGGNAADRSRALALANTVLKALGPTGRLYSTVDSVAAIALAAELSAAKVIGGTGLVEIDGARFTTVDAVAVTSPIRSVRAVDAVTAVEVTRLVEDDWGTFMGSLPIAVRMKKGDVATRKLQALDAVELEVTIEGGYKPGDLLWVCLPDALSRVVGGGQVKQFSVDFEGNSQVRVPLAATGVTLDRSGQPGLSRFAVCVRNMFEEERGGSPGYVDVSVAPPAGGGVAAKVMAGLRGLFGS
ncbi:type II protein secretion system protein [Minicystis rosea]|nr:type II protein secretion system protein [Minicystis rosea]